MRCTGRLANIPAVLRRLKTVSLETLLATRNSLDVSDAVLKRFLKCMVRICLSSAAEVTRGLPDLGLSLTLPVACNRFLSLFMQTLDTPKWFAT